MGLSFVPGNSLVNPYQFPISFFDTAVLFIFLISLDSAETISPTQKSHLIPCYTGVGKNLKDSHYNFITMDLVLRNYFHKAESHALHIRGPFCDAWL